MKYKTKEEKKAAHIEACRIYRLKYPDRRKATKERWRKKNMDRYRAYAKKQREKFPERVKASIADWAKRNSAYLNARKAERLAQKKKAMPAWANKFFIEEIYDLARRRTEATGFLWSVDYIVPITSDKVCGLHVEHNLRVIPHVENIKKKNHFWPDGIGFDKGFNL